MGSWMPLLQGSKTNRVIHTNRKRGLFSWMPLLQGSKTNRVIHTNREIPISEKILFSFTLSIGVVCRHPMEVFWTLPVGICALPVKIVLLGLMELQLLEVLGIVEGMVEIEVPEGTVLLGMVDNSTQHRSKKRWLH